jgi:Tfp pilus assembly protein PilP
MKGNIVFSILLIISIFAAGHSASTEEAKVAPSGQEQKGGSYAITDVSLRKLQEKELPEEILEKLKGLKDQKYTSEKKFLSVLEKTIGKDHTVQYKSQILQAAWYYNPEGRHEPFKPPIEPTTPDSPNPTPIPEGSCDTPLGKFELGQFRLTGTILGEPGDRARVLAPDGKSYTLIIGTCIGKFKGKVISISENCVTIKETKRFQEGDKITIKESETQLCINPLEKEKTP